MLTRGYSGTRAYCQSKLAQIMFTFDLAEELDGTGVTATCLHPASYMDTTMVRGERRQAAQHGGGGGRRDPAAGDIPRDVRSIGPLLRRAATLACRVLSL